MRADAARRARTATRSCRRSTRGRRPRCAPTSKACRSSRDLALAQPADGGGQQPGHLGAERGGDLRRPGQQEVAGEDRREVAPAGVDALDAAAGGGLVDDVVVVERAQVHELDGDAAPDRRRRCAGRPPAQPAPAATASSGPQPLAAGDDQVAGDLGEERVRRSAPTASSVGFDPAEVVGHRPGRLQRAARATPRRHARRGLRASGTRSHPPTKPHGARSWRTDRVTGRLRATDPRQGRRFPCSNASPTGPAGSSCWRRRKRGCSTTTTSAPSTSCSG